MNSADITAITEFRRFANTYIYPDTVCLLIESIRENFDATLIAYEATPQAVIKFTTPNIIPEALIKDILKLAFISHFNDITVSSLVRSRIHTDIQNEKLKNMLRLTNTEIQYGNPYYLGLLFNVTMLNNNTYYIYL